MFNCCFGKGEKDEIQRQESSEKWDFIKRKDGVLLENGVPFRFASFNVPGLLMTEDRSLDSNTPWVPPTPQEQEDAILTVKGAFGRVIRTYTLGFGPFHHIQAPNTFYEPAFVAMDHALALARIHKIRLVIPIINNHFKGDEDGPENFGDYWTMCHFRGLSILDMFKSKLLRQDLKDIITYVLNRRNTVNGIYYKDDPTILAWQLGNELGGWDDPAPPADWSIEMASLMKSIAPNTLVMDGTQGGLNLSRKYPIEVLESPLIDIFDNHYYHGKHTDLPGIKRDAAFVVGKHKKAFVLGEFGFDYNTCEPIYAEAYRNKLISGAMIWSLRYHCRDGGFYIHRELEPEKGFWSYHVPGFPSTEGFSKDDHKVATMVRKYGMKMMGISHSVPFPLPPPARPSFVPCSSPLSLTWFGSPWAASYNIYRSSSQSPDRVLIASRVLDNVAAIDNRKVTLYSDKTAVSGVEYTYLIVPVSVDGFENPHNPLLITAML